MYSSPLTTTNLSRESISTRLLEPNQISKLTEKNNNLQVQSPQIKSILKINLIYI